MSTPSTERRWIQRLISEEKPAAAILLLAGIVGLALAQILGTSRTASVLHPVFAGLTLDLAWFAADGLLVVFFFVAGLELRHEFTKGSLQSPRQAAVPIVAAALGMVTPALLFLALSAPAADAAWGVPMATDLPLALALVAVLGRGLPLQFRAFILSLAIVDDALSILVIAVVFGGDISFAWCLATGALAALYIPVQRRSGLAALVVGVLAWLAMLHTGIHATVLGVVLGLATTARADRLRDRWQPVAGLIAVPLFVATSLAVPLSAADFDPGLVTALTIARVVGKPVGILLGATLAIRIFRPEAPLAARFYLVAGSVAGLGFSVSMLFAELGLGGSALPAAKLAILSAMVVSGLVAAGALMGLRRSVTTG